MLHGCHPRAHFVDEQARLYSRVFSGERIDLFVRDLFSRYHHTAYIWQKERPAKLKFALLMKFEIVLHMFANTFLFAIV